MEITKNKHNINMLNGPLVKSIIKFALPIALSSILQQLFNSADTAIAGKFGTADALAAVGTNGEIVALAVSLSAGLAVGANVVISHFIGAGQKEKISDAVRTSMVYSLIAGILLGAIGVVSAEPLLRLINTPDDILNSAVLYLRLYSIGIPFLMVYDFGSAILRSKGDSKRPLVALILSGFINVLLNLFFIIILEMSVAGVALATDISTLLSAIIIMYWLSREDGELRFSFKDFKINKESLIKINTIGIPAALQGAVFCVANIFIQSAINTFGSEAAAGSAIAMNFEYIAYYVNTSFGQAASTFTAQNFAARNVKRCKKIFIACLILGLVFAVLMCGTFVVFRHQLSALFSSSADQIKYSCERIMIILLFQPLCTLYEIPAWTMRGLGYSTTPALETMFGICLIRIVWIYTVFRHFNTLNSLFSAFPFTWIITSLIISITFILVWRKTKKSVQTTY